MKVVRANRQGSTVVFNPRELRILRDSLRWLLDALPDTRHGRGEFSAWIGDRDDAVSLLDRLDRCSPRIRLHLAAADVHHAAKVPRHVLMLCQNVKHGDPPFDAAEAEGLLTELDDLAADIRGHGGSQPA